jgi:hypothetical protein
MHRKGVPAPKAVKNALSEVLHWCTASRAAFDATVADQVAMSATVVELLQTGKSRLHPSYEIDSDVKQKAVSYLVQNNLLKIMETHPQYERFAASHEEFLAAGANHSKGQGKAKAMDEWTALGMGLLLCTFFWVNKCGI